VSARSAARVDDDPGSRGGYVGFRVLCSSSIEPLNPGAAER
jgi:hypothetical protein